jgi:5'-3' exonuclease
MTASGDLPYGAAMPESPAAGAGKNGRLLLLDAPSMYFRAFYGVPATVTSPDGMPINAIRGFLEVLARQIVEHRPTCVVACFDYDWRPQFRVDAIPSYKTHRIADDGGDGAPDPLAAQVPVIEDLLDAIGIARLGADGFEADDVIGTLCHGHDGPVDVITGDRDLFQLVRDDKPVRILYAVERYTVIDEASVTKKYGIPGRLYGEFAILRGDPSDGLPGVAGVGAKTAAALINRFGTTEEIVARLAEDQPDDGFPAGARAKLRAALDYLAVAPAVVRVVLDVDLAPVTADLPAVPVNPDGLVALSNRYGLDGPLNRLLAALASASGLPSASS